MILAVTDGAVCVVRERLLVDLGHFGVWDEVQGLVDSECRDWKASRVSYNCIYLEEGWLERTKPAKHSLRNVLNRDVADAQVEMIAIPGLQLCLGRKTIKVQVDAGKVTSVLDGVLVELLGRLDLDIGVFVKMVVSDDENTVVEFAQFELLLDLLK